jgi:hypothetical protein
MTVRTFEKKPTIVNDVMAFFVATGWLWWCIEYLCSTGSTAVGFIYLTGERTHDWHYLWIQLLGIPISIGIIATQIFRFLDKDRIPFQYPFIALTLFAGLPISAKLGEWTNPPYFPGGYGVTPDVIIAFGGAIGYAALAAMLLDYIRTKEF